MTFDDDYRTLAQKVRQTARAQLLEIRAARQARKPGSVAPVAQPGRMALMEEASAQRRRRKSGRMERQLQDLRLQAALAAGDIEIWDGPMLGPVLAEPSLVPTDCPVLMDTGPAEVWDAALLPSQVQQPGSIEIWDWPKPRDRTMVTAEPVQEEALEYFGPPWDPEQSALVQAGDDAGPDGFEQDPGAWVFFGPFVPGAEPVRENFNPEPALADFADPAIDEGALTLSAGMRVLAEASGQPASDEPEANSVDVRPNDAGLAEAVETGQEAMVAAPYLEASPEAALASGPDVAPSDPAPTVPQISSDAVLSSQHMLAENLGPVARMKGSDLSSLPGAGPGLIWMLQKCGISSLEDLAEADAATLVPKLGLVGQIVNVQGWQRFAQRQVGLPH